MACVCAYVSSEGAAFGVFNKNKHIGLITRRDDLSVLVSGETAHHFLSYLKVVSSHFKNTLFAITSETYG